MGTNEKFILQHFAEDGKCYFGMSLNDEGLRLECIRPNPEGPNDIFNVVGNKD